MKYVPGFEPFNLIRSPVSIHPISPSVSRRFYCCWFYGRLVRCLELSLVRLQNSFKVERVVDVRGGG